MGVTLPDGSAERTGPTTGSDHVPTAGPLGFWERSWTAFERWTPHVLLGLSVTISLFGDQRSSADRLTTLGLAALAGAWVAAWHTSDPDRTRRRTWFAYVYLTGLIAWAALLMSRDVGFFAFAISGFLHAYLLRPRPMVFVATGATSFVILAMTWEGGFPQPTPEGNAGFVVLLLIQTFLIGFGVLGGERQTEILAQRRQDVDDLEALLAENEGLQAQLVSQAREAGVHDERQRMAREIHDTLAQGLTGIITQLEAADQAGHDDTSLRRHLDTAARLARESLAEARRSVHALGPGALERGRLHDALNDLAEDWSERTGVRTSVTADAGGPALPAAAEVALLRVAQEALANVAKHAGATRAGVTLSHLDDRTVLDVRDDGCGFDTAARTDGGGGFGLTSMRQRVTALGGALTVESRPGAGTAISAWVPIPLGGDLR